MSEPSSAGGGRGISDVASDVASDADPGSGYRIVTVGQMGIIGGTSAVVLL